MSSYREMNALNAALITSFAYRMGFEIRHGTDRNGKPYKTDKAAQEIAYDVLRAYEKDINKVIDTIQEEGREEIRRSIKATLGLE